MSTRRRFERKIKLDFRINANARRLNRTHVCKLIAPRPARSQMYNFIIMLEELVLFAAHRVGVQVCNGGPTFLAVDQDGVARARDSSRFELKAAVEYVKYTLGVSVAGQYVPVGRNVLRFYKVVLFLCISYTPKRAIIFRFY